MRSHWEVSCEVSWLSLSKESSVLRAGRGQVQGRTFSPWGTAGGGERASMGGWVPGLWPACDPPSSSVPDGSTLHPHTAPKHSPGSCHRFPSPQNEAGLLPTVLADRSLRGGHNPTWPLEEPSSAALPPMKAAWVFFVFWFFFWIVSLKNNF